MWLQRRVIYTVGIFLFLVAHPLKCPGVCYQLCGRGKKIWSAEKKQPYSTSSPVLPKNKLSSGVDRRVGRCQCQKDGYHAAACHQIYFNVLYFKWRWVVWIVLRAWIKNTWHLLCFSPSNHWQTEQKQKCSFYKKKKPHTLLEWLGVEWHKSIGLWRKI